MLPIYKFLSPAHLLREQFQNDSNTLDRNFYNELLYWMGLEETREGSKTVIRRPAQPQAGSLLELILERLKIDSRGVLEADRWDVALELALLWVNRLIFLKLLESQLLNYHNQDRHYRFLGPNDIQDFGDLYNLFFGVLAVRREDRNPEYSNRWARIPYMNSRLFELSPRESVVFSISHLDNNVRLTPPSRTVLKNPDGTRDGASRKTLDYLLSFLDAYDFSSEGTGEIQDGGKTLINASILGLIFEKINGYKDGSFFTPGYITQYMARQSVHAAILTKFREIKGWDCADLTALYNHIRPDSIDEANKIINSLKIVDPAVGSGHFLVSVLNELIATKSFLGILTDKEGKRLRDYKIVVENDELFVEDAEGGFVTYYLPFGQGDRQRVWETLFHEKQTLIENCLFGVDINPNSVQICKLRLWIELLKHSYYTSISGYQDLETLPNLDIKIREGNSLVSRYPLDVSLSKISSNEPRLLTELPRLVSQYQRERDKATKNDIETHIEDIKSKIRDDLEESRPLRRQREVVKDKLDALSHEDLFGLTESEKTARDKIRKPLEDQLAKIQAQLDEENRNPIYRNSFEWRFEFPEVLDPVTGDFIGFDVVIGNPPYGLVFNESETAFLMRYEVTEYSPNSFSYFIERGFGLLPSKGGISLIVPAVFLAQHYFKKLRDFIVENSRIEYLDLHKYTVFSDAETGDTVTFLFSKDKVLNYSLSTRTLYNSSEIWSQPPTLVNFDVLIFGDRTTFRLQSSFFNFQRSGPNKNLGEVAYMTMGIKPYQKGKGTPPQDEGIVNSRPYDSLEKLDSSFKEYIVGSDFDRYQIFPVEKRFIKYGPWLAEPRPQAPFERKKIVIRQTADKIRATIDSEGYYALNNVYLLEITHPGIQYEVLLGILNSRLVVYIYQSSVLEEGRVFAEVKKTNLIQIPLPHILFPESSADVAPSQAPTEIGKIASLVANILAAKKADSAADTLALEAEIDQLVYRLYGLTEDEIKIVEGR